MDTRIRRISVESVLKEESLRQVRFARGIAAGRGLHHGTHPYGQSARPAMMRRQGSSPNS